MGFLRVLGGVALFLMGVRMLSAGMEKIAGTQIQVWLDRMTSGRLRSAAFGAVATALIQSSGLLMVTMIGLINAHVMTLEQAIAVMMGQEIGTTLTAQVVAFKVGDLCFLFVVLGFILTELPAVGNRQEYGEILLGLGILFLGMNLMSEALRALSAMPQATEMLAYMARYPLAGVMAGAIITALVQSSSAVTGLTVAMGISQTITLAGAVAIILGANIGSCITGLLAASRLSRPARRASTAQILINVLGVALFFPFIPAFTRIVYHTSSSLPRQIANAHTIFNVVVSAILFPFVRPIARATHWLIPTHPDEEKPRLMAYADRRQYRLPAVAMAEAVKELHRIGEVTAQMIDRSCQALVERDLGAAQWVLDQESQYVDPVCVAFDEFVNGLLQADLSTGQRNRCLQLKKLIIDIERVGDMSEDLAQAAVKRVAGSVSFSSQAEMELGQLWRHARYTYGCALQAVLDDDADQGAKACRLEEEFDGLYLNARQAHIERVKAGTCLPEADVIFVEALRNLERISDHADNLGIAAMQSVRGMVSSLM